MIDQMDAPATGSSEDRDDDYVTLRDGTAMYMGCDCWVVSQYDQTEKRYISATVFAENLKALSAYDRVDEIELVDGVAVQMGDGWWNLRQHDETERRDLVAVMHAEDFKAMQAAMAQRQAQWEATAAMEA